ncbi:M20/M25/M40 family metallo-hydrolase [Elongatibacter sediminis]|uniref:M20/M25/M40 family metallo-hydrolase n=1 Tax=Elongatibacter sediminis TaxID=3119006 RepID=A0AAW9R9T5_9GAMM
MTGMKILLALALLGAGVTAPVLADDPVDIEDQAVHWLQEFIRIDTVNPPGNESRAVDFLGAILTAEGISWQSAESAPGRGNLWARIEGGDKPALILLQHTDVVPADPKYWTTEPLSGEIREGYLWGRGALDMKSTGISQLASFIRLHRAGLPLNRDVVLIATADEEAGGYYGAGWLLEHHPEIFEGAGILINEGGGGTDREGQLSFDVEVTQKVPVWLRLEAVDTPGHGSMPNPDSSVTRIVDALNRLREHEFPARIIAPVDAMFKGLAPNSEGEWAQAYADMNSAIGEPGFLQRLQLKSPALHALTRDTCSLTRMGASNKINVVPPEAWAEIDCRMLPDRPAEAFIDDVRALLDGTGVDVEVIMAFTPAVSTTDGELYQAIEAVIGEHYPGVSITPSVSTGFTDSHFTRDAGIDSYGFDPSIVAEDEFTRIHGNDERIRVDAFRRGVRDMHAIISTVVYD